MCILIINGYLILRYLFVYVNDRKQLGYKVVKRCLVKGWFESCDFLATNRLSLNESSFLLIYCTLETE